MKTYCKPAEINIESLDFIKEQVHLCFTGKRSKRRFQNLLVSTGKITRAELREEIRNCTCNKSLTAIDAVAEQAHADILARSVSFEPVRQFQLRENGKLRNICEESPWQQIFEYIAKGALDPLFRAKLLPIQYGSLPGKGQIAGKRQNERILRRMLHNKTDAAKCDVKKAYPSTTVECVMNLLRRDIGKNKPLLWLVEAVMANYPDGVLLIGGYLPCWLFNYVMSYVLRYILSHRKVRRGKSFKMILGSHKVGDLFLIFQIPGCQLVLRCYTQEAVFHIVDAHAGQIFRVVPHINFLLHAHIYQFRGVKIQLQAVQLQGHAAPSDADGLAGAQQHQLQIVVTGGAAGHAVAQALVPDLYAALAFILGHTAAVVVAVHVAFYQGINSGNDFGICGDMLPALQNGL